MILAARNLLLYKILYSIKKLHILNCIKKEHFKRKLRRAQRKQVNTEGKHPNSEI